MLLKMWYFTSLSQMTQEHEYNTELQYFLWSIKSYYFGGKTFSIEQPNLVKLLKLRPSAAEDKKVIFSKNCITNIIKNHLESCHL